jgi:hypothetical protein
VCLHALRRPCSTRGSVCAGVHACTCVPQLGAAARAGVYSVGGTCRRGASRGGGGCSVQQPVCCHGLSVHVVSVPPKQLRPRHARVHDAHQPHHTCTPHAAHSTCARRCLRACQQLSHTTRTTHAQRCRHAAAFVQMPSPPQPLPLLSCRCCCRHSPQAAALTARAAAGCVSAPSGRC